MKNAIFLLVIIITPFLFVSCEESFSPLGNFDDRYVINCIIRNDTTIQIATISRSYLQDDSNNQFIKGAKITLTCSNSVGTVVYLFRDTSITNSEKKTVSYYYLKNFNPSISTIEINPGVIQRLSYQMYLEVILPDGQKLTSSAFPMLPSPTYVNSYITNNPVFLEPSYLRFVAGSHIQPELVIKYSKYENGIWVDDEKLVPQYYSGDIPVYPKIDTGKPYILYDTITIRRALADLSLNNINKQNFKIRNITFMYNTLDENFNTFLSAQQSFLYDYSYRVTESEYTNINGGIGIFGSMYTIKKNIDLTNMIKSLGYRTN